MNTAPVIAWLRIVAAPTSGSGRCTASATKDADMKNHVPIPFPKKLASRSFCPAPDPNSQTARVSVRAPWRALPLLLGFVALLGSPAGAQAAGDYVLNQNFNGMTTGAAPGSPFAVVSTGGGAVAVQEVPFAADKSVELTKLLTTGTSSCSATFASQSGRVVFEAKVLSRETAGFKGIPYIYDSSGNAVASVSFQDGNIKAYVGGTAQIIQSFSANVWYLIRVVVDTSAGVFDLYVDGVRKEQAQALRTKSGSVSKVTYYMDGTNTGTLYLDNVRVYTEAGYIGSAPSPVFDVRDYGAVGDGSTMDTAALQKAIDAGAGTGGSVLLTQGTYLSGTLTLPSNLTFFIDSSATLRGSTNPADYPTQTPATGNTQLSNCQRALLYAPNTTKLTIDGGGTIDGQGDSFSGTEATRPLLVWAVLSNNFTVQNLYLMKGAVWSLVSMESDQVLFNNINLQSNNITHDGIDVIDGQGIVVQNCAVQSGDDAMCLKTGVRRGIDTMTVKDSMFGGYSSSGGSNGIKLGTATYGGYKNVTIQDCYVKGVQYAAMAVESRQGADVNGVTFNRISFANAGAAFFVYLAQQATTHPVGDVPKLGSINNVAFTDIAGFTSSWSNSPHQGSLITGQIYSGTTYRIQNLSFTNATVTFDGGSATTPAAPPEATPGEYPESNMFGDLPAWAYYLRHVDGVTFTGCTSSLANPDVRDKLVQSDVVGLSGSP
jgi:polygalacturonase